MRTTFRNAACERKTAQWGFLSLRVSLGPFPNQKTRYSPGLPGRKISSSNPGESKGCGKIFGEKEGEGGADSLAHFYTLRFCRSKAILGPSTVPSDQLENDIRDLVARFDLDPSSKPSDHRQVATNSTKRKPFPPGDPGGSLSFPGDEWGASLGLD
jgi:hypothetical protein